MKCANKRGNWRGKSKRKWLNTPVTTNRYFRLATVGRGAESSAYVEDVPEPKRFETSALHCDEALGRMGHE